MGNKIHGFAAWLLWRQYYLSTLPTTEKKFRVAIDWFADLFFPRDITILSGAK
jgi:NADH dehydrogenase